MMRYFILILLMISFVSAVDIDFDCPDEIFVDEEFECVLEVFDGDGEYDVKVDLDGERDSVLEVWNDGVWKSGYFYLIEFIEDGDERDVRLRVSEDGNYDGVLKLRQGDNIEFFDVELDVEESGVVDIVDDVEDDVSGDVVLLSEKPEVVSLNGDVVNNNVDEFVYVSKDARVVDWLPYGFALFLIFVIVVLVWERF